jgi:recombinational DNA repair protein (RecF pathway)
VVKKLDPDKAAKVMLNAGLKPLEPYKGAGIKWKSQHIECGRIVYPRYDKVIQGQRGCKSCGYEKSSLKRKIANKTAKAFMLKAGLKPLEPYKGAGKPWICMCLKCRKRISPTLASVKKGTGCAHCSGNAKLNPKSTEIVMLKAGLKPLEPYKNSSAKWRSRCLKCKKIVSPTYAAIQQGSGSCVYCARNKVDEKDAIKLMLLANLKPLESYAGNSKPWKSRCLKCKKIVSPTYTAIQQGQGSCAYCSGKKVDPNDAVKIMIKAKLKPLTPYKSHDTKWKCKCLKCGKVVFPRYDSIKTGQGGCIYCAEYGINMNVPSYLYLITSTELNAHKVGIGNHKKINDRLAKFNKHKWDTYKVWNFKTGGEAWKVESTVLKVIRKDLGLPIHLSKEQMPKTEGQTETISADSITLLALEKIIKRVIKSYRN